MKNLLRCSLFVLLCAFGQAFAQQTTTLCSPPQMPSCVSPQWGSLQPGAPDPDGRTAASTSVASANGIARIRVAMTEPVPTAVAPKIVVDDGRKFASQTKALVAALKSATFDADGKLVSGEDKIKAALERVNAVSRNHQLVLYLKAAPKLDDSDRALLAMKVEQLNALIGNAARK